MKTVLLIKAYTKILVMHPVRKLISNIDEFADKVCSLIESPDLRHTMGKAAIQSSQKYSTDQIMAQWMSLFNELLSLAQS